MSKVSLPRIAKAVLSTVAVLLALLWLLVTQPILLPGRCQPAPEADPERLRGHVNVLSVDMVPRDYGHVANLDRAASYIKKSLAASGGKVSEQVYSFGEWNVRNKKVEMGPYRNVIAAFGPETPERIVVGAHYDAYGQMPGADDNASGVAGLLELGRLLGLHPPPLRVELVAFTLEEPPYFATQFMGSAQYAAALKKAGARVRAMISLEMIGFFTDEPRSQGYPVPLLRLFYPSRGNFITVVGKGDLNRAVKKAMREASELGVQSIAAPPGLPGVDYSDHRNFWEQGYPAVMISDTAFYRNRNYHKAGDTAAALDYRRMAFVVDGVHAALRRLCSP